MSILINKDTKVITQGITGKTGQFHTRMCRDYANGKNCFVAGVNPKKAGEDFEGIPIYASVKDARQQTGASVSVISTRDHNVIDTVKLELKGARADDITPVGLAMTRDGRRAFVTMGRANHVAFVDVATRKVTNTVLVGKRAWHVALNPTETELVVTNGLSDDVTIIDIASAKAVKSVPVGRVPYMAVILE